MKHFPPDERSGPKMPAGRTKTGHFRLNKRRHQCRRLSLVTSASHVQCGEADSCSLRSLTSSTPKTPKTFQRRRAFAITAPPPLRHTFHHVVFFCYFFFIFQPFFLTCALSWGARALFLRFRRRPSTTPRPINEQPPSPTRVALKVHR